MLPERQPTALTLNSLDDRIVPAAVTIDLTTVGAQLAAGEALVHQTEAQPTGTGHIHSFVRFQGAASGGGSERGYNTTARPLQFDENKSPSFTRELTVGAVPRVDVDGKMYREFLLDINQKSSASNLSLDQVQVFLAAAPNLTGYLASDPALGGRASLGGNEVVFDLDASYGGEGVSVKLDARLNSGSGAGDMLFLVPESAFAGATADTFVYLYTEMGGVAGATANGGFEEWAVKGNGGGPPIQPPPPAELSSLSGYAYIDEDRLGFFNAGDIPIAGVNMQLRGQDINGHTVVLNTITGEDGSYKFENLLAGRYSILQDDLPAYEDSTDVNQVGSLGGQLGENLLEGSYEQIMEIMLVAGIHGINYNFGEQLEDGSVE